MYRLMPLTLLLLSGCHLPWDREQYDRTPNGWHVHWKEQGTITTGLHSRLELYSLFDAAMERSFPECAAKVGLPESYVRSKIRKNDALYTLVDDFFFKVEGGPAVDAPNALYATGETEDRIEVIIAFYDKDQDTSLNPDGAVTPAMVPVSAPSWSLKASTKYPGLVYYGIELDGQQYPALGYELHWQFTNVP